METIILDAEKSENIKLCADIMKSGGVIAFPTETVYGLGADALDKDAVSGIFTIKGRPEDNPLIVHVASSDDVKPLVASIPDIFEPLIKKFWPGPLTLIMKKSSMIPDNVTAGLDTVAIRMPEHPAALALIQTFGGPVAAPSANPSGKPSPTKAAHVLSDIGGKVPYILDGGDCKVGLESTVLDISGKTPKILRPGCVTYDELKNVLGTIEIAGITDTSGKMDIIKTKETPKSPGMKYRHYAPKAPLTVVIGAPKKTAKYITDHLSETVAALMFTDYALEHPNVIPLGNSNDYEAQASFLFEALRTADNMEVSSIYTQLPKEDGLGVAIANRLKKAAGKNIVDLSDLH